MNLGRRSLVVALLCVASAGRAASSPAALESPPGLSADDQRDVARIVDYLQGLGSAKSRFVQMDARGGQAEGTFYLQRPGKARFEYDPPSGLLIAADGRNVTVVDRRLKTEHVYPLASTPLDILLARNIRLDRGVAVRQVVREGGNVTVVAEDARRRARGQIMLTFSEAPLALTGWSVKDGHGGVVKVRLSGLSHASPHDPDFFELPNPRRTAGPDAEAH